MYVTVKQDKKLSAKPYMKNLMQMWFQEIFSLTPCSDKQQTSLRILFPTNSEPALHLHYPFFPCETSWFCATITISTDHLIQHAAI